MPLLLLSPKLRLRPLLNQKLMLIQVPGTVMVDMVWDTVDTGVDTVDTTAVDTMDTDTHTLMDTDTT